MDVKAKAPDPDDLTSEGLFEPPVRLPETLRVEVRSTARAERPQPDRSAPHIPPPD